MDYLTNQQCYAITQRLIGTNGRMDDAICEEYEIDRETLNGIMESHYYEFDAELGRWVPNAGYWNWILLRDTVFNR